MARLRLTGNTQAALQGAGATRTAAHLFERGYDWWGVYRVIRERFPQAADALARTITRLGREAWSAAKIGEGLEPGAVIPRAEVPINRTLPHGIAYRYVVVVYFTDPTTGQQYPRSVEIDSAVNLTMGELRARAEVVATSLYQRVRVRRGRSPPLEEARITAVGLESVERRTP